MVRLDGGNNTKFPTVVTNMGTKSHHDILGFSRVHGRKDGQTDSHPDFNSFWHYLYIYHVTLYLSRLVLGEAYNRSVNKTIILRLSHVAKINKRQSLAIIFVKNKANQLSGVLKCLKKLIAEYIFLAKLRLTSNLTIT